MKKIKKKWKLSSWVDDAKVFESIKELNDDRKEIQEIPKHSPDIEAPFLSRHSRLEWNSEVIEDLSELWCGFILEICHFE